MVLGAAFWLIADLGGFVSSGPGHDSHSLYVLLFPFESDSDDCADGMLVGLLFLRWASGAVCSGRDDEERQKRLNDFHLTLKMLSAVRSTCGTLLRGESASWARLFSAIAAGPSPLQQVPVPVSPEGESAAPSEDRSAFQSTE